jgi:hypothetical protein
VFPYFARLSVFLAAAVSALVLAACSPTYDWREINVADGTAQAAFPAKVRTEKRTVSLGGAQVDFSLAAASVKDGVFAVGHARLPADVAADPARPTALGKALMKSLYENLQVQPPEAFPAYGEPIEIHGHAGGKPVWLLARVWVQGNMLVEAVATGSEQGLPAEPAREFVKSLRFLR